MADVEGPESWCLSDSGQAGGPAVTPSVFLASPMSDPSSPSLCPDPLSHPRPCWSFPSPSLHDGGPVFPGGGRSSLLWSITSSLVSDGPQLCPQHTGLCRRHSDLEEELNAS